MSFSRVLSAVSPISHTALRALSTAANFKKTPLYDFHVSLGGQMVPFCGWLMALRYKDDPLDSHFWCREKASFFDTAHMGAVKFHGADREEFVEWVTVADVKSLEHNQIKLSSIPNHKGGIIDDCMVTQRGNHIYMVINAACVEKDTKHFETEAAKFRAKGKDVRVEPVKGKALLALQGPKAPDVLQRLISVDLKRVPFMTAFDAKILGENCLVTRSGYTGEDGFELSVPNSAAVEIASAFLDHPDCKPAGLAPRDSLRLEAGLCLYGNDIDDTTSPVEGSLLWTISQRRRKEGKFIAWEKMFTPAGKAKKVSRKRIGITVLEGAPARHGAKMFNLEGKEVGIVTSGTFAPLLGKSVAMGYLPPSMTEIGTELFVEVRKKKQKAVVCKLPFWPTHYYKM